MTSCGFRLRWAGRFRDRMNSRHISRMFRAAFMSLSTAQSQVLHHFSRLSFGCSAIWAPHLRWRWLDMYSSASTTTLHFARARRMAFTAGGPATVPFWREVPPEEIGSKDDDRSWVRAYLLDNRPHARAGIRCPCQLQSSARPRSIKLTQLLRAW